MKNKSQNSVFGNVLWKFSERITAQMVSLVVSIVLARIIAPSDYGIIAVVTIFITIANVFVSDGLGSALIQKKNADALDFSSVLYFNIAMSVLLYLLIFFAAPYITAFFGSGYEALTMVLRVMGLRLVLSAINSIQQAYVSRKMIFKKFFVATLLGTVVSAVVGIYMAYEGFGVWALVAQYLTNTTVDTVVLAISLRKLPILQFSIGRLKSLLGFGLRVLGMNLLIACYEQFKSLIIGKTYSSADLAYFTRGRQFPELIITNINSSISSVLFPKLSQDQDDVRKIKDVMKMSIKLCTYIMCPMMLGLAAVSHNFVIVILTEKWLPCVPLIQLLCIYYLFFPIHSSNMQAIKAVGRSDISLKLEIVKKLIELVVLLCTVTISVNAIVIGMTVCSTSFVILNALPNKKLIGYSAFEQIKDILPTLVISVFMVIVVMGVGKINATPIVLLCMQVFAGVVVYFGVSLLIKKKELHYLLNKIRMLLQK